MWGKISFMNEMYAMSIGIHDAAVIGLGLLIAVNALMVASARRIRSYAKRMRMVMPLFGGTIAVVLFTGAVMMAAKRLSFSVENILMIVIGIIMIILEARRYKALKRTDPDQEEALMRYRATALKLLGIEAALIGAISAWMLL